MTMTEQPSTTLVINLLQQINYDRPGVSRHIIAKDEHSTYALMCITAGTAIPEHAVSRLVCLIVLEGRGTLQLTGQEIDLTAGVLVKLLPNTPHALQAIENLAILHI
jgi:quercetin dioxygenase-like cupin family protein